MCSHKWEQLIRPYQYQIDNIFGIPFLERKHWLVCKECVTVKEGYIPRYTDGTVVGA